MTRSPQAMQVKCPHGEDEKTYQLVYEEAGQGVLMSKPIDVDIHAGDLMFIPTPA